jgi:hypothetical protein
MRVSDRLRDRAARLRALAIKARDQGKPSLPAEITRLVTELSDQADDMDRREGHEPEHRPFNTSACSNSSQQPPPADKGRTPRSPTLWLKTTAWAIAILP